MKSQQNNTPDWTKLDAAIARLPFYFEVDKHNEKTWDLLKLYFSRNPEFEKDGRSLQKGILLQGRIGSGKTIMMELFKGYGQYSMKRCNEVAMSYAVDGDEIFFDLSKHNRCFDDLGSEPQTKHFGGSTNIIREVFQRRAHQFIHNGLITHVTTNLTGKQIEEKYGERVLSRIKEMCNVFVLGQPSDPDRRTEAKLKPSQIHEIEVDNRSREEKNRDMFEGLRKFVEEKKELPIAWGWDRVYWHLKEIGHGIKAEDYEAFCATCKHKLIAEKSGFTREDRQVIAKALIPQSFEGYVRKQHVLSFFKEAITPFLKKKP